MLTIGWLAVILGVLGTQWADGRRVGDAEAKGKLQVVDGHVERLQGDLAEVHEQGAADVAQPNRAARRK